MNLFLEIVRDGVYKLSIDIPYLNDTIDKEFDVNKKQEGENDEWFAQQFDSIDSEIKQLEENNSSFDINRVEKLKDKISEIKDQYNSRKTDDDVRMQTRDNLRKQFQELDNIENESSWPTAEDSLKDAFINLKIKLKVQIFKKIKSCKR